MASICCSPPERVPPSCFCRSARRGKSVKARSMFRCRSGRVALMKEPIRRFSRTVISGKIRRPSGTWTTPSSTTWCDSSLPRSFPSKVMVPDFGRTSRDTFFRVVDLPAPLAPSTVTISPWFTSRERPQSTWRSP